MEKKRIHQTNTVAAKVADLDTAINNAAAQVSKANEIRRNSGTTAAALTGKAKTLQGHIAKIEATAADAVKVCNQVIRSKAASVSEEEKTIAKEAKATAENAAAAAIARINVAISTLQRLATEKQDAAAAAREAKKQAKKAAAARITEVKSNIDEAAKVDATLTRYIKHLYMCYAEGQREDEETIEDLAGVGTAAYLALCNAVGFTAAEGMSPNKIVKALISRVTDAYPYTLADGSKAYLQTYVSVSNGDKKTSKTTYYQAREATPREIVKVVALAHVTAAELHTQVLRAPETDEEGNIISYNFYRIDTPKNSKFLNVEKAYRLTEASAPNIVAARLERQKATAEKTLDKKTKALQEIALPESSLIVDAVED